MTSTTLKHMKVMQEYIARITVLLNGPATAFDGQKWVPVEVVEEARESLSQESLRLAMMIQYETEASEQEKAPQ